MKAIKLILLAGVSLLALGSCQKAENLGGQAIRFSATANPTTKTAYGDYDNTDKPTKQSINWIEGESVRVWSDIASLRYDANVHYYDYVIANPEGNKASLSNNTVISNGLVYSENYTGDTDYNFWAISPAKALETPENGPENGKALYTIVSQTGTAPSNGVIPADMDQAVLLASATDRPWKAYGNTDKSISLVFNPAFTAFEITLLGDMNLGNESITLTSVVLKSADGAKDLAAKVTATFGSPISYSFAGYSDLTYTFPGDGVTINESTLITFTVLAIPEDVEGLKLIFNLGDGQVRTATLTSSNTEDPLVFGACQKHRLYGLAMPDGFKMFASEAELKVALTKPVDHDELHL